MQNRVHVQPLEDAANIFNISSVSLQNRSYSHIASVFADISAIQSKVAVDGVIGYQILSPQRSYFDFSNQKLYLEEVQPNTEKPTIGGLFSAKIRFPSNTFPPGLRQRPRPHRP